MLRQPRAEQGHVPPRARLCGHVSLPRVLPVPGGCCPRDQDSDGAGLQLSGYPLHSTALPCHISHHGLRHV